MSIGGRTHEPGRVLLWVILLIATSPLWVWGLDSIFHFGYGGD